MAVLKKTIICLAASRKTGGRCIVGKEISGDKDWVRPVSDGDEDAITNQQSLYANACPAQVLDIIEIPFLGAKPKQYQTENFLIDSQKKWVKKGVFDHKNLKTLLDSPVTLWSNLSSSYNDQNDRISRHSIYTIKNSLFFIQAQCVVHVKIEGKEFNNPTKKIRCEFNYNTCNYLLPVTDPFLEQKYLKEPEGEYAIGNKFLCVSLGPVYNGFAYLFVAVIL